MDIICFKQKHRQVCLDIFLSNEGKYFDSSEKDDFERFLNEETVIYPYYVMIDNNKATGCGGFYVQEDFAYLCWGMVRRDLHKSGIGTQLLKHRLQVIEAEHGGLPVRIDTSQHTQAFYEKFGFVVVDIKKDGFGPGIDEVAMVYQPQHELQPIYPHPFPNPEGI